MPTGKEWEEEIGKRTKDQLTQDLAAFKRLEKWPFFSEAFQLKYFNWMVPDMEARIEQLAKEEEEEENEPTPAWVAPWGYDSCRSGHGW